VTLTFDLLTVNMCHAWRVTWPTLAPSMRTPCLSVLELWVITFPVGYHWKCVCGHCPCAESRDRWVGGQKQLHFWDAWHRFAYSLCNFGGSTMKVIKDICENNARPCVKQEAQLSPSDRAMRLVSRNLANCHATVQKLLIRQVLTKPMVWSWRFSWRQCAINKPTPVELCISPVYRRLAVAKFSKSTM